MPMDFVGYVLIACLVFVASAAAVVAFVVWLARKVKARRERILREREGRRDGYITDGGGPASQETQAFFAQLDKNDRDRWAS